MEADSDDTQTDNFNEWIGVSQRLSDLTVSSEGATRQKAIDALNGLAGKELVNTETGIKARLSANHRDKIVSNSALEKSKSNGFNYAQHFATAACIDKAWERAMLAETHDDRIADKNIVAMKRFEAPIMLDNEPAIAYITVKESVKHGHRIYSLELMGIKKPAGKGGRPITRTTPAGSTSVGELGNTLNERTATTDIRAGGK